MCNIFSRIQIQQSDWNTDTENLEKLLVRTLNDNFERLIKTLTPNSMLGRQPVSRPCSSPPSVSKNAQQVLNQNKEGKNECCSAEVQSDGVNVVPPAQLQLHVIPNYSTRDGIIFSS